MPLNSIALSASTLPSDVLKEDKANCKKFGPCGVGKKALYVNSFYIDRRYYIPYGSIQRVYKRIAMSKGGFTGKGMFATMPYLVVEYDNGKEKQCNFKYEQNVDLLLAELARVQPQIKRVSARSEQKLAEKAREEAAKQQTVTLTPKAQALADELGKCEKYLADQPGFAEQMSSIAKRKRSGDRSAPHYKWVAVALLAGALVTLAWGAYSFVTSAANPLVILLIGMGLIFLFSALQVMPTAFRNKKELARQMADIQAQAQKLIDQYHGSFPVPARYAHPIVLRRMKRVVESGRADTAEAALEEVKKDLKALNADVQVEEWEYDEVVAIKPMFLLENYQ